MDYTELKDACVQWIRDWFAQNGPKCNAVVGISGGKDSTVVAALCAEALGPDRVVGVALPSGSQSLNEADEICHFLGIRYECLNIGEAQDAMTRLGFGGSPMSPQAVLNIPPRLRMTALYAVSQCCSGMVANTCNLSEDYIGYATLYGDASGSFAPIARMVVREVIGVGKALGLPAKWVEKTPDDGLPGSCPDEEKFGFSYAVLDRYIREGVCEDPAVRTKIDSMHSRNKFKTEILRIPAFEFAGDTTNETTGKTNKSIC